MFDSVLDRGAQPPRRLGRAGAVAVGLHVAIGAAVAIISARAVMVAVKEDPEVTFKAALPPPPPPPPPPPAASRTRTPKVEKKVVKKENTIVETKEEPKEPPKEETKTEADTPPDQGQQGGQVGGVVGGVQGGVVGGVVGGQLGGQLQVLPFGEGMTRPDVHSRVCGPLQKTQQAAAAGTKGKALYRCTIMPDASVRNCRPMKTLPYMEQTIKEFLESCRYASPILYQGRPVAVDYVIPIDIQ